ncbi:phosphoinositide 3-kinase regulatory subunit 6 [Tachyglossus aculeatus]|uniref:phosphoinositide 3-kinase regulatory subunit 6 n=1 Tax=Tachyglossus aculeatus TaxID=9261 RepID=UPI0018F519DB|nr:phosphoinositide 3-kinase regulatory subunit 6 [Tachyglossus aculeatus]
MVLAEHSLPNEMYLYQEQVFLFVDPDLVSTAVCNALLLEVEGAQQQPQQSPWACMVHVVAQAMRMALGEACDVGALQSRLKNGPRSDLECCFHAVVAMVQQAGGELGATQGGHVRRLEELYRSLLGAEVVGALSPVIPLPSPRIGFHLWTDKEQLWKELVRFLHGTSYPCDPCDTCDPSCLSRDPEAFEIRGLAASGQVGEPPRFSILSTDSGIERDLPPESEEIPEPEQSRLQRKGGVRKRVGPLGAWLPACWQGLAGALGGHTQPLLGAQPLHTARVVILGDDRMLGRLAQAYLELRKRETQRLHLTHRLNLQFYYIPVLEREEPVGVRLPDLCELATYLGRVDRWYDSVVSALSQAIPKLAQMPSVGGPRVSDPFIVDVMSYYVRMGTQPVGFQIYMAKILLSDPARDPILETFLTELSLQVPDSRPPKGGFWGWWLLRGGGPWFPGADKSRDSPGTELSFCYRKAVPSNRMREVEVSLRCTGFVLKAIPSSHLEDPDGLNARVAEVIRTSNLAGKSFSVTELTFRATSIKVWSHEQKPLTVTLDKDTRRIHSNVAGIEVAPCLEPSSSTQKPRTKPQAGDLAPTTSTPKPLLLPINTFSGSIQ